MFRKLAFVPVLVCLLAGCRSNSHELFPISEKSHWSYLVRSVNKTTDRVSYEGPVAVGNTLGYSFQSDLGSFHLAWSDGNLITDQMTGSRLEPPLPLMTAATKKFTEWRGWVESGDNREPAKAKIFSDLARLSLNGNIIDTHRTLIVLTFPNRQVEITNWYEAGVGLVRQEQRTNGRLDLILDYLDQS